MSQPHVLLSVLILLVTSIGCRSTNRAESRDEDSASATNGGPVTEQNSDDSRSATETTRRAGSVAAPAGDVSVQLIQGSFHLYPKPAVRVNPSCDVHLALELATRNGKSTATLEHRVLGTCELYVKPDRRTLELTGTAGPCGVIQWTSGVSLQAGYGVEITDHRQASRGAGVDVTCADLPPALLVVDYRTPRGIMRWFSHDE